MEKWRRVWRNGLAPQLSVNGLRALQMAIVMDDARLLQGVVTAPPALDALRECAVHGTCAISFCGWQGEGLRSVGQVEEFFHRVCDAAEGAFHESAACRYFLNWYDETPRNHMRRELLAEVNLALRDRRVAAA
jgi:hypothetical protein